MGTNEISLISSGVWLIPIVVLAAIAGLYLLVRYWRQKIFKRLQAQRSQMHEVNRRRRDLEVRLHAYSPEDMEPYGSRVASLRAQIADIDRLRRDLERRQANARDQMAHLLSTNWLATVGAPFDWYNLDKETAQLANEADALAAGTEVASEGSEALDRLSWDVARHSREVRELQVQVNKLLDGLSTHNVHGEAVEQAVEQEGKSRKALSRIPPYFFEAAESDVLDQADRETVAGVHRLVEEQRPLLEALKNQAQAWTEQYNQTAAQISAMREAVEVLGGTLNRTPSGVDTAEIQVEFNTLSQVARTLQDTQTRLEAENIVQVGEEAARMKSAALELEGRLSKAIRQSGELEKRLAELIEGLRGLSPRFAALGSSEIHPVLWGDTRKHLSEISRQTKAMSPAARPRTPEQIDEDLKKVLLLSGQFREMSRQVEKVEQAHNELLKQLDSPELQGGEVLRQQAQNLVERATPYSAENWPRGESPAALAAEVQDWAETFKRLAGGDRSEGIPEGEMLARRDTTQALVERTRRLSERVERAGARLKELQAIEEAAGVQLDSLAANLTQASHLAKSNARLAEINRTDLENLTASLEQLDRELDQRGRGSVEAKATAIAGLGARVEAAGNAWLDQFTKGLEADKKALSARLAELEAIAPLDDPAIAEARRLLQEGQAFDGAGYGRKSRLNLEETLLELKRRANFAQKTAGTGRALEDLGAPLLEAHANAAQNRQHAHEQIQEIIAWIKNSRGWPPTSLSMDEEIAELQRLDAQWEDLKRQSLPAIQLVKRTGDLNAHFYNLAERARAKAERIAGEQDTIEAIEDELDEMIAQWRTQQQVYRLQPEVAGEIKQMLDEGEAAYKSLQRQAREGKRSYTEVHQNLEGLVQRLRRAQVQIDDQHVIDVNGRTIAYR